VIFYGQGCGGFGAGDGVGVGNGPISIISEDLNVDGWPDLAVVNNVSDNVSILYWQALPEAPSAAGPNQVLTAATEGQGDAPAARQDDEPSSAGDDVLLAAAAAWRFATIQTAMEPTSADRAVAVRPMLIGPAAQLVAMGPPTKGAAAAVERAGTAVVDDAEKHEPPGLEAALVDVLSPAARRPWLGPLPANGRKGG
jgi:hypothetical protein